MLDKVSSEVKGIWIIIELSYCIDMAEYISMARWCWVQGRETDYPHPFYCSGVRFSSAALVRVWSHSARTRRKWLSSPINLFVFFYSIFISCWPVFSSWGSIPTRTTRTELQSYSKAYLLLETQEDGSSLCLLVLQGKIKEILVSLALCIGFSHTFKRTLVERLWTKKSMCCFSPRCFSCLVEDLPKEAG